MNCQLVRECMLLFLYHELDLERREGVETHLNTCDDCAGLYSEERKFHRSLNHRAAPPKDLMTKSHYGLMRSIRSSRVEKSTAVKHWNGFWRSLGLNRPIWQPTAVATLLLLGFFAGRTSSPNADSSPDSGHNIFGATVADIESVRLNSDKTSVEIVIEQVKRRTIEGSPRDPNIQQLLLSTALDYPNSGVRLDTIDALKTRVADHRVKRVFQQAMIKDSNAGVRLKAFEALKPHRRDPEIRNAFLKVLMTDQNPGMRIEAINVLTELPDRRLVEPLRKLAGRDTNSYIRLRSRRILHELNDSPSRF